MTRIAAQIQFIVEADRLKGILRQTLIADGSRAENSAEHSWHFALALVVLSEYAPPEMDLLKVLKMALLHDLVEIDAGDTFVYDAAAVALRPAKEKLAADRIFAILPADQATELRALWDDFEAGESAEARYAAALDRLCPILLNLATGGHAWRRHGVTVQQVRERNLPAMDLAPDLRDHLASLIDEAEAAGIFRAA